MALDEMKWGTARPLFRIGNDRYVLNQNADVIDDFPKAARINQAIKGKEFEHIKGYRGIIDVNYKHLDKASTELIRTLTNSTALYMRPHFNFWKEYWMRCLNGFELNRLGPQIELPYQGVLRFREVPLEDDIPAESSGSFHFDGTTKVEKSGLSITGDATVEMWIKTPNNLSSDKNLFSATGGDVVWRVHIMSADKKIRFQTEESSVTHDLKSDIALTENTWYHIMIRRVSTNIKRIVINGVVHGAASDTFSANNITTIYIGEVMNAFDGLCQIMRFYSANIHDDFDYYMVEAIPSVYLAQMEIWWDFSQGNTDDLLYHYYESGVDNDGTVTGLEKYFKESFKDPGSETEALASYYVQSWFVQVELPDGTTWENPKVFNYGDLVDKEGNNLPATIPNAFVQYVNAMEDRETFATDFDNTSVTVGISRAGGANPPYDITMTIIGEVGE